MRIARMSEEEAYAAFERIRFVETDGEPFCVKCGCLVVYRITRTCRSRSKNQDAKPTIRRTYKCADCGHHSSVTSKTIFASHKLSFRDILCAIALFADGAKGFAALHLMRNMGLAYKTAFVLAHKLRQAICALQAAQTLSGKVEIDGAYFGGYVKPKNLTRDRVDRRKKVYRSDKRQCVVILRERRGRSVPFVCAERDALPKVTATVDPGSIIYADEAKAYEPLHAIFKVKRINHSKEGYAVGDHSTNQAESFFSRLRRAEIGIHHHIAGRYLSAYAGEMSWREDNRRISNGEQFLTIVAAGLHHPVSRTWKGYWQRRKAA